MCFYLIKYCTEDAGLTEKVQLKDIKLDEFLPNCENN